MSEKTMIVKSENIVEKFQRFVGGLSPEEQVDLYKIMSAIRGPDEKKCDSFTHNKQKENTWFVRLAMGFGFFFYSNTTPYSLKDFSLNRRQTPNTELVPSHWVSHTEEALAILKKCGYDIDSYSNTVKTENLKNKWRKKIE